MEYGVCVSPQIIPEYTLHSVWYQRSQIHWQVGLTDNLLATKCRSVPHMRTYDGTHGEKTVSDRYINIQHPSKKSNSNIAHDKVRFRFEPRNHPPLGIDKVWCWIKCNVMYKIQSCIFICNTQQYNTLLQESGRAENLLASNCGMNLFLQTFFISVYVCEIKVVFTTKSKLMLFQIHLSVSFSLIINLNQLKLAIFQMKNLILKIEVAAESVMLVLRKLD